MVLTMQKIRLFLFLTCAVVIGISGCSNVCNSVGQAPGSFSGGSGWTGVANIGITGIHAGICGAGILIDKSSANSSTEQAENGPARTVAEKDLIERQERLRSGAQAGKEKGQ